MRSMITNSMSVSERNSQGSQDPRRNLIFTVARILISLALLVMLLRIADLRAMMDLLRNDKITILLLLIPWLLLDRILHAWRWILLLRAKIGNIPTSFVIRVHFISNFLGHFLPFNIGNDLTRVVSVARYASDVLVPLSSVIVDRILGFASLAIPITLIFTGAVISQQVIIRPDVDMNLLVLVVLLIGLSIVLWKTGLARRLLVALNGSVRGNWNKNLVELYDACLSYQQHQNVILRVLLILEVGLANGILVTYFASKALGIEIHLVYFLLFVPIISFMSLLPISINGIGIAEGGFVFFFSRVGASNSEALMLGLVMRTLMLLATLPGGFLLAIGGYSSRAGEARDSSLVSDI